MATAQDRCLNKRNPFARILIRGEGKDATPREVFSVVELKKLYSASLSYGRLRLILPILGETGCRLSKTPLKSVSSVFRLFVLQVMQRAWKLLMSSGPPLDLGMI